MEIKLFAVTDGVQIKIVGMTQIFMKGRYKHTLTPYLPDSEPLELTVCRTESDDPYITELTLSTGRITVWRTGLTVNHKDTWLQILDSDERGAFPGEYLFTSIGNIPHIALQERDDEPPPVPLEPKAQTIPQFVAEIMKRDAISAKSTCAISLEALADVPVSITSCFHMFDRSSINRWLERENSCPVCKSSVNFVQPV
jgi:hypothetical protein